MGFSWEGECTPGALTRGGDYPPSFAQTLASRSHTPPSHELVQLPVGSHVWGPPSAQVVCPGTHTPAHAPATHAWPTQATAAPQDPEDSQVWTPLPEH
jgi:hypothetical protein